MSTDSDDYVARNVDAKLQQESEWLKTFEENLKKSRNLNNEITALLESFQDRLVQLDQSIVPLYEKTALLRQKQANIRKVLKTVDAMQQFYGRAAELESSIREGNASVEREKFIERMEQLAEAISFFSSHPTYQNQLDSMKLTFESGCCALEKEFRNVLLANSVVLDAAVISEFLDNEYGYTRLRGLVTLRNIEQCAQIARWLLTYNPEGSVIKTYANIRCDNMLRTLTPAAQQGWSSNSKVGISLSSKSAASLRHFDSVILQIEAELISKVIADVSAEAKVQQLLFGRPLLYVLEHGSNLMDGISCSLIPFLPLLKHINAHYLQLLSLGNNAVENVPYESFVKKINDKAKEALDGFFDHLTNDSNKFVPMDGNVHQITSNTLNFLNSLMDYRQTVTNLLIATGAKGNSATHFPRLFARALSALGLNLKNKAGAYGDETLAAVFLLNNNNYIHNALQTNGMFAVVGEHNSQVRSFYRSEINAYSKKYLQSWNRVVSIITVDLSTFDDRTTLKNALVAFNAELGRLINVQQDYCFSDVKLARDIKSEIKSLICEPYAEVYARVMRSTISKNTEKHLKYTPESLGMVIDRLFDVTA
ncbi:Exo70 exocyst complex subunit [Onchocerca flexuosa]|uniref:Exocyst complex component 7 n=1 Tax=Onchocerca flexuosa TaxID=387005 RepID=A0A238C4L3_9BILA|nr:Exo70 exocyst complex subunit [Onchocerca flexuosa]